MSRILFILVLLSLGISITGQTKPAKKKSIIPPSKSKAAEPSFSVVEFDMDVRSLPPFFLGHDAVTLYRALLPLTMEIDLGCGRFEKSDQCQKRMNSLYERKIWRGLTPGAMYAFSVEGDCTYIADLEVIVCPNQDSLLGEYITWSHKFLSQTYYVGENAFGVKRRVVLRRYENLHIADNDGVPKLRIKNIAPDSARQVIDNLRLLWIGSFVSPFTKREKVNDQPTIDQPEHIVSDNRILVFEIEQIWLYDFTTGKVYARG